VHNGFIRAGKSQFFPRKPFHRLWVIGDVVNFGLELSRNLGLFLNLHVQLGNFAPVIFILLDQRQISHADEQQDGHRHQGDDRLG